MTESLSYLAAGWALYAIAIALERPTVLRQLAVVAAIAAALPHPHAVRDPLRARGWARSSPCGCSRPGRGRGRAPSSCGFWPTALPVVLVVLAFVRQARVRPVRGGLARRVLGALARLRPTRGREMVRLPPRRLHRLPRGRAGRGRADRPVGARARRESGVARCRLVRRPLRLGQRLRAARRRRVHQHAVGLRPATRPLRVLPRPALARSGSSSGSPPAFRVRSSRP